MDDVINCPTCGVSHPRKQDDSGEHHTTGWTIDSPAEKAYKYRGKQQGRGGHFDAGHQKRTSPIDEDSTAEERYQREKKMGPLPYSKDDPESRAGGYTGPYPAGWNN